MSKPTNNYADKEKFDKELTPFITEINQIFKDNQHIIDGWMAKWRLANPNKKDKKLSNFCKVMILREHDIAIPEVPAYVAECFINITTKLASSSSWQGYTWRDEMIGDGLEDCLKRVYNYDNTATTKSGNPNPFGYFTQMVHWAFCRRKDKEMENLQNTTNIIDSGCIENHLTINLNDRDLAEATNYVQDTKQKMDTFKNSANNPKTMILDETFKTKYFKEKNVVDEQLAIEYDDEINKIAKRNIT